jgi:hypothetical protein
MATGAFTNGVLAGDMDGDDDVDLVSANNSISQTISVHKNNGSGVFAAPQHFAAGEGAFSQALADIDGDEDLDVLCTGTGDPNLGDLSSSAVLVFRNRGNATFDPVKNYPVGSIVEAIAPADLDGDGHVDLAVAGSLSNVWILPNDRQGGFGQPAGLNAGDGPTTVVAADFTSDGKPDLAVTNYRAASVSLFVNESTAVDRDCNDNGVPDACDIAGGTSQDGNRDGVPDECAGTAVITFLRGDCNGDGEVRGVVTDAIFLLNFNFVGGPRPGCLAACDANGDGGVIGVVTDAVYILTYNFLGGPEPVAPYPACGPGLRPADETLGCEASGCP